MAWFRKLLVRWRSMALMLIAAAIGLVASTALPASGYLAIGCLLIAIWFQDRAQRSLRRGWRRSRLMLNHIGQGVCMFGPDRRLRLWNRQFRQMYHLRAGELRRGLRVEDILELRSREESLIVDREEVRERLRAAREKGQPAKALIATRDHRCIEVNYLPVEGGGWVLTHEDQTERVHSQQRLRHIQHHDLLTDLPNRAALDAHLAALIERSVAAASGFSLLCVDIDRLRAVNAMHGHAGGDRVLCEAADRLAVTLGDAFVARIGGDQFVVIGPSPDPAEAEMLARRIAAAFDSAFMLDSGPVTASCSIGISLFPDNGASAATLIGNAVAALERAKTDSTRPFCFFETTLDRALREKRHLHLDLIAAVAADRFEPHFQPQATPDGAIVGFEALARWRHAGAELIPPARFVPIAEESGLISEIDRAILKKACREAASWSRPLTVAVNLSPADFRRGEVSAVIMQALIESRLAPSRLHIEITEGVLIEDFERARAELRKIKAIGVQLALDDFGTGYSSLSYLQAFPFDRIKIDRGFVAGLGHKPQSAAIVNAILSLGRSLGIKVVAEGVETEAQRAFLTEQGCDELQGYLIGKPRPIDAYAAMVRTPARHPTPAADVQSALRLGRA